MKINDWNENYSEIDINCILYMQHVIISQLPKNTKNKITLLNDMRVALIAKKKGKNSISTNPQLIL